MVAHVRAGLVASLAVAAVLGALLAGLAGFDLRAAAQGHWTGIVLVGMPFVGIAAARLRRYWTDR